eukprot:GEZU01023894.1.p1 GENE.GEZU01023894.1~~GEZU01023894.1.p1  ORF type:complete len:902 (-),score=294.65 GEZU01023894.1:184-2889(-)
MRDFKDLLEESTHLIPEAEQQHLHKGLGHVFDQSKKILTTAKKIDVPAQSKALYLLAAKGFDVESYNRSLGSVHLKAAFEPMEPIVETDIDGYLKHEHDMTVLVAIEEAKKLTNAKFDGNFSAYMDADWRVAREELKQALLLRKHGLGACAQDRYMVSKYQPESGLTTGFVEHPYALAKRGRTNMDARMKAYAAVVYYLNQHRKSGKLFPVIQRFIEVAKEMDDRETRKREVVECWTLLQSMLNEEETVAKGIQPTGLKAANKPGAAVASSSSADASVSPQMRTQQLSGAKRFLENQYRAHIIEFVNKNRHQSGLPADGNVSPLDLIRGYLNAKYNRDGMWPDSFEDMCDGYPLWPLIFFCLRCGYISEAIEVAQRMENRVGRDLITCLKNYTNMDSLPTSVFDQLNTEYRRVRHERDLFKQAVYLVVGRCDTERTIPEVFAKTEDFMWLKLSIIRETGGYTLKNIQDLITKLGSKYFAPQGKSLLYFKLLLLVQLFEEAIEYLLSNEISGYQVEAVHFAIAMHYYRALHLPERSDVPLFTGVSGDPNNPKKLNFNYLIKDYVRIFAHTDPQDAVSYFYLIEDDKTRLGCIKDLVIESKDTSTLLGTIQRDGTRKRGCIEDFLSPEQTLLIIQDAAKEYEAQGRLATAVDLYFMAEEHQRALQQSMMDMDTGAVAASTAAAAGSAVTAGGESASSPFLQKILLIMNKELGQVLVNGNQRDEIKFLAQKVDQKFRHDKLASTRLKGDRKQYNTFVTLMKLTDFFDYALTPRPENMTLALELMDSLNLLPFDMQSIEDKLQKFKDLDETVRRNFGEIIRTTAHIIFNLHTLLQQQLQQLQMQQQFGGPGAAMSSTAQQAQAIQRQMQALKARSSMLLSFAGLIQSRVPTDVYQQLIRIDSMLK